MIQPGTQWFRQIEKLALGILLLIGGYVHASDSSSRKILIDTPSKTDPRFVRQMKDLDALGSELKERRLVIRVEPSAAAFRVRVVGLDGDTKIESSEEVKGQRILDLVDSMPMRQDEMKTRK